jgi:hypothetical protein
MRQVAFGQLGDMRGVVAALRQIERASNEGIDTIADAYTVTGTLTETRELDVDSPSLANLAAVLGTLLSDFKRRGAKRT